MKRINLLDEKTSNKIAAGEVVERPSSVVKELIENSIDASSKNILIEIEDGGQSLIKIVDDGVGIHPEDIKKAFLPHATSKIESVEDIFSIKTLGFRGEALASIASVSKLTMKSKTKDFDFGREIIIEGGSIKTTKDAGINNGTTIEVRDLFFNIPARKKFLKSTSRENSLINEIVTKIALSNPNISFILYNSEKKILHTFGTGNLYDVIRNIYGKTIAKDVLYFENHLDTVSVYGYIGREIISRGSRTNQSIFVNNRYIKNQMITVAVENAFKSFSTVNKHPFFITFVDVYPELLDVNIHPTKAEIKFKDEKQVFKCIFDGVHSKLKEDVLDTFSLPEEEKKEEEKVEKISFTFKDIDNSYEKDIKALKAKKLANDSIFKEEVNILKNNDFSIKNTGEKESDLIKIPLDLKSESIYNKENNKLKEDSNLDYKVSKFLEKEQDLNSKKNEEEENSKAKFPTLRIIGQFNKTYIIGEFSQELYLIDQHAAHEKILFEKYMKEISKRDVIIQPLLVPIIIDLSLSDFAYFEENRTIFSDAGFLVEDFGGNSIKLQEVPYFLGKINSKNLFLKVLDNLKNLGSGKTLEVKYNKIATMACKAAVKAHDELNLDEMRILIEDLRHIENPFHCPHGRPTIIKMTLTELEKKFKRIT